MTSTELFRQRAAECRRLGAAARNTSQSDKRPEYQLSTARASRPAVVIRTILTLIILPPARNFSKDRVTRLVTVR